MKRIRLLFCGGTIAMHRDEKSKALVIGHDEKHLLAIEPRLGEVANVESRVVDNIDSTNMTPAHWQNIAAFIEEDYGAYDGFVVAMGTNTMAYCSSALSFALQRLGKPVILAGAQIPAESITSDARNNLTNAVRLATMDIAGVYVVFGSKIILGCRAKKVSESDLDAFKTFNQADIGTIGIGIMISDQASHRHTAAPKIKNTFDDRIACLTLIPGLSPDLLFSIIKNKDTRGVILRAYGSGDIPSNLIPPLLEAKKRQIPVVVTTQCPGGATIMGLNDVGLKGLEAGVIQAFDMSMEAMSTKLMWLLGQRTPYAEMKTRMEENIVGEVNPSRARYIMNPELE